MKALLTFLLCIVLAFAAPAQMLQSISNSKASAAASTFLFAETYIDMNTSSPGTTLTTAILGNGTLGVYDPPWTISTSPLTGMTVGTHDASFALPSSLIVGNTTYTTSHTSQAINYDHSQSSRQAVMPLAPGRFIATWAGWINIAPACGGAGLYDYVVIEDSSSHHSVFQYSNGTGSSCIIQTETNPGGVTTHSAGIVVTPGKYWGVLLHDAVNGIAKIALYNTSMSQISGSPVSSALDTGVYVLRVRIGNNEVATTTATSVFENQIINTYLTGTTTTSTGVFPLIPAAAPTQYRVNSASHDATGSGTTSVVAFPTTVTGDLIVCDAFWNSTSLTGSVADVANGTYTAIDSPTNGAGALSTYRAQSFYKASITGASTPNITLTTSGSTTDRAIACQEYHGVAALDKHPAFHVATGTSMTTTATGTTAAAAEIINGFCLIGGSLTGAPIGIGPPTFTQTEALNFEGNIAADLVTSATGSYTFTAVQGSATNYVCGINSFQ